ncbi:MAG: carbohydrate deacetylase [Acidimicrobiia bacterium]
MRLLIVNADDYGLTDGIARAVLDAHHRGVVTSTSLIATGPAFARTVRWLDDAPELATGMHFAAVGEDPPVLSAREVPSLVDRNGLFPLTWRQFVLRAIRGAIDPDDLRREFLAQLELVRSIGRPITHADAHQHLHLWPLVGRVLIEIAGAHAIPAVRLPRGGGRSITTAGVATLRSRAATRITNAQLITTDDSVGISIAGRLTPDRFARVMDGFLRRSVNSAELTVHPGLDPDPQRSRYTWGFAWAQEHATLCAPATRARIDADGWTLGSYNDLAPQRKEHLASV